MSVRWPNRLLAAIASLTLVSGSACMHAPDRAEGYGTRAPRVKPKIEKVPVTGYRVRIKFEDDSRLVGELLAAEPNGVVMVRTRKHGDQTRSAATIKRATVFTDPALSGWLGGIGGGTGVLIAVTLASGWYFVVLMPIVVAGGAIAFGVAYAEGRVILRDDELRYLHQYARWPQGRPQWPAQPLTGEPLE